MKLKSAARLAAASLLTTVGIAAMMPTAEAAHVKPSTHVTISHKVITLGKTSAISGYVSPNLHNHVVYLQRRSDGRWSSITHHKLNTRSRFSFTLKPAHVGTHAYRVVDPKTASGLSRSISRTVWLKTKPRPTRNCTAGYSPCIAPGSDVDCAGGSGNGPRYVQGPIRVTGSDPYGLDSDNDGWGCES